ncbi:Hypothetical predicted protein [Octopus vulgaris]|uniref:Uncharacterized protein n=1 Tax=Octopus vulgaris TaxID=6645 RepID=A0AA36ASD9_OCTVU|nr:Hypothetical predicted protein [Octopus vulgaris]
MEKPGTQGNDDTCPASNTTTEDQRGALINLRNNENQLAFDLAKEPKIAALLQCSDISENGDDYLDDTDGSESD